MTYKTEQEEFWAGEFGDEYLQRNTLEDGLTRRTILWSKMLRSAVGIETVREFGCNIGINLAALHCISPQLKLYGSDINERALSQARQLNIADLTSASFIEPTEFEKTDLTFASGVLIHINPSHLKIAYQNLYENSKNYILLCEYYNPTPVEVNYRGHAERLFKRDFAGDMIDAYNLKLVDYGFNYHRDNIAPHDDCTWFLLQK